MKKISFKFTILLSFLFSACSYASDNPLIPEVFQREYIYTNIYKHPKIQTYGLVTCVALSIFHEGSGDAVLAHIDAKTSDNDVKYLFSLFRENASLKIELHGGVEGSKYNLMPKLVNIITTLGFKVAIMKQNRNSSQAMAVIINLVTGKVSNYDEIYTNTPYLDRLAKIKRMKLSRRLYRHLDSLGGGDRLELESPPEFGDEFIFLD